MADNPPYAHWVPGPPCHPYAHWVQGQEITPGCFEGVCSICGRRMAMKRESAYEDGYRAGRNLAQCICPFPPGSEDSNEWFRGYGLALLQNSVESVPQS